MLNDRYIINALLLLYWEKKLGKEQANSIATIKTVLEEINPGRSSGDDYTLDIISAFWDLAMRICTHPNDDLHLTDLIRQVKLISRNDSFYGDILVEGLTQELTDDEILQECVVLSRDLHDKAQKIKMTRSLKELNARYVYGNGNFDVRSVAKELIECGETYGVEPTGGLLDIPGVVDCVNLNNMDDVAGLFELAVNEVSPDEVLKFPLQGLNKMMGKQGGARRGECMVIGGLSHHGKSVLTMQIVRGIAMHNTPKTRKEGAIPTILMISAENDLTINLRELYSQCYTNTYGTQPAFKPNTNEATRFICEKFSERGWNFEMLRLNPDDFTIQDFQSMILNMEANNKEIIVCSFDYLSMMSTKGIGGENIIGQSMQLLWKRVRNMFTVRKTFFVSPHQLSTEAQDIVRHRPNQFLSEILNKGYYKHCRSLHQEVDVEINIQKYTENGVTYMGYGRGKHRGVNDTPENDKVCWYQLDPAIGILDDIHEKTSRALRSPKPELSDEDYELF